MTGPSDWPLPPDGVRFIVPHYHLQALRKGSLTRGAYLRAAGYYPNALGHAVARHQHLDDLFLYCVGGEGTLAVDGITHPVVKGDLMMLPRGTPHAYGASEMRPWTLYWVHFAGDDAASFWNWLGFNRERPVARLGASSRLTANLEVMTQVGTADFLESSLIHGSSLLREILTHIKLLKDEHDQGRRRFSLDVIHALMQDCLHTDLDLDTLARAASMTRHAFCRRYKSMTGVSPYKHYLYLKMKRACHFLDATDQSVTHIAELMGYSDPYYFSRIFRQVMGMPPSQYRRKYYG